MSLEGFSASDTPGGRGDHGDVDEPTAFAMAGNAMSLPVLGSLLWFVAVRLR
jgi:hypothetical protein